MSPPDRPKGQPLSGPLQTGVRLLPPPLPAVPSARLATGVPARPGRPCGRTTGLPRSVAVTVWVRSRLSAGGASTAPEEFGASGPDHVPFWSKRFSILRLACVTTFIGASRELTNTTPSWFPTPLMLGVATWPRGCVAILSDEATALSRLKLRVARARKRWSFACTLRPPTRSFSLDRALRCSGSFAPHSYP